MVKRAKTPPVPSVDDCKAKLTVPRDKSVFYTSKVQSSAEAWAAANGKNAKSRDLGLDQSLSPSGIFANKNKGGPPSGPPA